MRKLIIISFITFLACSSIEKIEFTSIDCTPEPMPKYDSIFMTYFDENQNSQRDSLIRTIEKKKNCFQPLQSNDIQGSVQK